jgi:ectoine hydroxylase-related dioxygenase (phytanoyl-CoA dioxygenase family)
MRDGYAVLPGWLPAAELPAVRAAAEALDAAPACPRENNTLMPLRWDDDLVNLLVADPARVAALRAATGATDLRWISGYLSVKEPRTGALDWHQDWWCWDHPASFQDAAPQIALLVYLSDTDEATGALRVRREDPVTLAARAGDAVALDYRLEHGTHPNDADHRRDAVLLSFAPDWARLPADIRAHLIGHLAQPVAGEDPAGAPVAPLLPRFDGPRADLPLNRTPPARRVAA